MRGLILWLPGVMALASSPSSRARSVTREAMSRAADSASPSSSTRRVGLSGSSVTT